jgi:RsiW-degrading membrane proteinase PrsW (M82 family)
MWLFATGAAAAFVALVAERYAWGWVDPQVPQAQKLLIRAFLLIALVEELAKISLMQAQLLETCGSTWRAFAISSAWVGAGFAGAENCLYILHHGAEVMWTRAFTATPFHVLNAVVAARLLWIGAAEGASMYAATALVLSVGLHGFYDYLIFTGRIGQGKFWFALALVLSISLSLLGRPDTQTRRRT